MSSGPGTAAGAAALGRSQACGGTAELVPQEADSRIGVQTWANGRTRLWTSIGRLASGWMSQQRRVRLKTSSVHPSKVSRAVLFIQSRFSQSLPRGQRCWTQAHHHPGMTHPPPVHQPKEGGRFNIPRLSSLHGYLRRELGSKITTRFFRALPSGSVPLAQLNESVQPSGV
jgi:hypothetical protein